MNIIEKSPISSPPDQIGQISENERISQEILQIEAQKAVLEKNLKELDEQLSQGSINEEDYRNEISKTNSELFNKITKIANLTNKLS